MSRLKQFRLALAGWILLFASGLAQAHIFEVCLHRLADAAEMLKSCQIKQTKAGECMSAQQQVDWHHRKCVGQEFIQTDINHAIEHGRQRVQGDASKSPYRTLVEKQQRENHLMGANLANFHRIFPDAKEHGAKLKQSFNTKQCKDQYEGKGNRWMFIQDKSLTRYALPGYHTSTSTIKVYFFAKQRKGECYPADPEEQSYQVVNIPELMLLELEQRSDLDVVRCLGSRCKIDLNSLSGLYEQYRRQYREYQQLAVCADIDLKNSERKLVKGKKRPERVLPDYCPTEEIQVKALNAKGVLVELSDRLFGPMSALAPN